MDLTVLRPGRVSRRRTANSVELSRAGWAGSGRAAWEPAGWRPEGPDRHKLGLSQPLGAAGGEGLPRAGWAGTERASRTPTQRRRIDRTPAGVNRTHAPARVLGRRAQTGAGPGHRPQNGQGLAKTR